MTPRVGIGLATASLFAIVGVHIPFFQVWLANRGMSHQEIGLLLAVTPWTRAMFSPVIGRLATTTARTRKLSIGLSCGLALTYVLFSFGYSFEVLLAIVVLLGLSFTPLTPLLDALAIRSMPADRFEYGKIRRWGSLAFIVFSAVGGWAWGKYGPEAILWLLVACAALNAGMQLFLPKLDRSDEGNPGVTTSDDPHGYAGLLRRVDFRLLLVSATLLQASHAMFYGFGSNHLYAEGLSQDVIAALWNEGVVAEIVLFSFGAQIVTRWSPTGLLVIAGLGGLIRWTIFALTSSIGWLVVAQLFHAATFAAMHLGAMAFIRTYIVGTESARATTLHGAIAYGLAFGLGWPVAGHLYSTYGKLGFLAMTSCSALGLLAALWLRRIERAGRL